MKQAWNTILEERGLIEERGNQAGLVSGVVQHSKATPAACDKLRQHICRARDWTDLDRAIEATEAAYRRGEIDQEQAEGLAVLADQEAQRLPEQAGEDRLGDLFKERPIRQVKSGVLGEDVLFVADGAEVPADNTLPVYRQSELRQLAGMAPEQLKAIHAVKQAFEGEVVSTEEGVDMGLVDALQAGEGPDTCDCCGQAQW